MIGETIGNFQIVSQLGSGGMGDVYLAEQMEIHTKVAIKLLHANISTDRNHIQRFFNEAVAVSKIKHAGIVRIFDVGFTTSGRAYLIMEFLEGETLSARIEKAGRLTIADVADIGRQTAGILAATHAEGVVHRDLKPDNIYLVSDAEMARGERVKILDFGIAKLGNTNLTGSANSMGTPTYMAPEQWNHSGKVDWRADAYSLGCVAFEMCCGRPPFVANSIGEACAMHLQDIPPRARSLVPEIPEALDALLARMLAKSPDDRPASMAEIAAGFSQHADTPTGPMFVVGSRTMSAPSAALAQTLPTGGGSHVNVQTLPPAAPPGRGRAVLIGAACLLVGGGAAAAIVVGMQRGKAHDKPVHHDAGAPAKDATVGVDAQVATPTADAQVAVPPALAMANPFIEVPAPKQPVLLGVGSDGAPDTERGFRPALKVKAPATPYSIQAHEVTWSELEPFLAKRHLTIEFPPWAQDPAGRAHVPATNVTWDTAHDYCQSIDAELPSDEEWEYAARGPERRPFSWGDKRLDLQRTHALAGPAGIPDEVMKNEQDKTPGAVGQQIFDLIGNAQEWTEDLWRPDRPNEDDSWVEAGETSYRALRGLPLRGASTTKPQPDAAAYREPACATGACNGKFVPELSTVGFRCVKSAIAKHTTTVVVHPKVDAGVAPADVRVDVVPPVDAAVLVAAADAGPDTSCTLESCQESGMAGECCKRRFPPKPPPPPALPDEPTEAELRAAFRSLTPEIRTCAVQAHVRGKHQVVLRAAPSGHIEAEVGSINPEAKACIETAARRLTVSRSKHGGSFASGFNAGGLDGLRKL